MVVKHKPFVWNNKRRKVALLLAEGEKVSLIAKECKVGRNTIWRWQQHPEFSAEVDRLVFMTGIALRSERLKIAKQVVKARMQTQYPRTARDLLDWIKYVQSETDGAKLDLTAIFDDAIASLAGSGQDGVDRETQD